LGQQSPVYWHDLLQLILYWSMYRRPRREHSALLETARASHTNVNLQQEVESMSQQLEKTWEQELIEQGESRGESKGELKILRELLRTYLEKRLGTVPEEFAQRIAAADLAKLKQAANQALAGAPPEDLTL
jgi:hypothetical protein